MRMRKKKNGDKRLEACADIHIQEPEKQKGHWQDLADGKPIYLEIGCGKGGFITQLAERNPDKFYIGFEVVMDVIVMAMEKVKEKHLDNVVFVIGDAENITAMFEESELQGVYLNFSDPWPKKRHAKRRLTYVNFLEKYKYVIQDQGEICFKTDNRPLFDFSLEQFTLAHMPPHDVTFDLHHSDYEKENIHTEYEDNFSAKGFCINRLVGTVDKKTCKTLEELEAMNPKIPEKLSEESAEQE